MARTTPTERLADAGIEAVRTAWGIGLGIGLAGLLCLALFF